MLKCIFPIILNKMSLENISVKDIANVTGKSVDTIRKKLSGERTFDIDEAMAINENIFPDVPFKELFSKYNKVS